MRKPKTILNRVWGAWILRGAVVLLVGSCSSQDLNRTEKSHRTEAGECLTESCSRSGTAKGQKGQQEKKKKEASGEQDKESGGEKKADKKVELNVTPPAAHRRYYGSHASKEVRTLTFEHGGTKAQCSRDGGTTWGKCDEGNKLTFSVEDYRSGATLAIKGEKDGMKANTFTYNPQKDLSDVRFFACDVEFAQDATKFDFMDKLERGASKDNPFVVCIGPDVSINAENGSEIIDTRGKDNLVFVGAAREASTIHKLDLNCAETSGGDDEDYYGLFNLTARGEGQHALQLACRGKVEVADAAIEAEGLGYDAVHVRSVPTNVTIKNSIVASAGGSSNAIDAGTADGIGGSRISVASSELTASDSDVILLGSSASGSHLEVTESNLIYEGDSDSYFSLWQRGGSEFEVRFEDSVIKGYRPLRLEGTGQTRFVNSEIHSQDYAVNVTNAEQVVELTDAMFVKHGEESARAIELEAQGIRIDDNSSEDGGNLFCIKDASQAPYSAILDLDDSLHPDSTFAPGGTQNESNDEIETCPN